MALLIAATLAFYLCVVVFPGAVIVWRGLQRGDFKYRRAEFAVFAAMWTIIAWPAVWLYFAVSDAWARLRG